MAVARSSSGGVAIRYVLPILWTTSYLHIMGHIPECRCNTGTASRCSTLYQVIPTKWPSYRDHRFCGVTSPYETYAWNLFLFPFSGRGWSSKPQARNLMMQAIANRGESLRSVTALLKTVIIADRIYIVKSEKYTIKSTQQFSLQSDLRLFHLYNAARRNNSLSIRHGNLQIFWEFIFFLTWTGLPV